MKIKKGDQVAIIAGKDRGKRGEVLRVLPALDKVLVKGVNVMKRHQKAKTAGEAGGRIEVEAPIHVSNVMLIDKETDKPTRIGYEMQGNEKVRISRRSGKAI